MNIGLVLASGELSIVEAAIVFIVFIYGPFWIYKQWTTHQVQKMLWDRIVNSWFFKHEFNDIAFTSSGKRYYSKYDIDPEKSIKIYDEEECDRSRSLRSQYENYQREAIYLPHLFGDKDYCDGFIIGKYGPYKIVPKNMTRVHDYWFAALGKDAIRDHFQKLINDKSLSDAITSYFFFAMEKYNISNYDQAPVTFLLMKEAEECAGRLIYKEKNIVDKFKKVCNALSVIKLTKLVTNSNPEEVIDKLKKEADYRGERLPFYVDAYQYVSELISKEGIIAGEAMDE